MGNFTQLKKMAGCINNKVASGEKAPRRHQHNKAQFYAVSGEGGQYVPRQAGTDGALAYTGIADRDVVQRKIKVGVSLRAQENEMKPLNEYVIDTVKFGERADTKLKNYKSGGATQGAHTIADAFIKKYQKEMLKGCNAEQAYNFYYNEFQKIDTDNKAVLNLYTMFLQEDTGLPGRLKTLWELQKERQDMATVTNVGDAEKVLREEVDRKTRLESSNEMIEKGKQLIGGKRQGGTSTAVRKDLVELISTYNEAYAQSALSTRKVGTGGRGEAGGMLRIKKYMSKRVERNESEDRRQLLKQFESLLDRDSTQALEAYTEDLGKSIAGGEETYGAVSMIEKSFGFLFDAVKFPVRVGIDEYLNEVVSPDEKDVLVEQEIKLLEDELATAFYNGLEQGELYTNILGLLSDKEYAGCVNGISDIVGQQLQYMEENQQLLLNKEYVRMWYAVKRAGGIAKRFEHMLYTLDDKYRSDQDERELDAYSLDLFNTVDLISMNRPFLYDIVRKVVGSKLNGLKLGDVCDLDMAAEEGIYKVDMQDQIEKMLDQLATTNDRNAERLLRCAQTQVGKGAYIDQQLQEILQEVISNYNQSDGGPQIQCDGWVLAWKS